MLAAKLLSIPITFTALVANLSHLQVVVNDFRDVQGCSGVMAETLRVLAARQVETGRSALPAPSPDVG